MSNLFKSIMASGLMMMAGLTANAQMQEPIISFHTTIYENNGSDNAFTIALGALEDTYVDIDFGFGPTEYKVGVADYDSSSSGLNGTIINGHVDQRGEVKIYGDPMLIDYLDIEGVFADRLDFSACVNMEILNVGHNYLPELDLSPFKYLSAVYLEDNPFDEKPLLIGDNHPELVILDITNVGSLDQSLDISNFPKLKSFTAYHCLDLRACDPTKSPGLLALDLDCTNVSSLDVSQNPELLILNISQTKITEIDLSANLKLQQFYCEHQGTLNQPHKLKSLDLSLNDQLMILFCSSNALTELDITGNPLLWELNCSDNLLTSIDLSGTPDIYNLNISKNYMDFNTIPAWRDTFGDYYYEQRPLPFDRSYPVDAEIDLESRLVRPNSTTTAKLFCGDDEVSDEAYSYSDGLIIFHQELPDSVYFTFYNTDFPEYNLKSTKFVVKSVEDFGRDNALVTMRLKPSAKDVALRVGIAGATVDTPRRFSVDFGDGEPKEFYATSETLPETPNATGEKQKVGAMTLYLPENTDLTAFGIDGTQLSTLDVTAASHLEYLAVTDCALSTIDLTQNRHLRSVELQNNALKSLDLDGETAPMSKGNLTYINASNNQIAEFKSNQVRNPELLDLSHNNLTEFDLGQCYYMHNLNLADNQITSISLDDCEELQTLNLSGNKLSAIEIPSFIKLTALNLAGNNIPLSKLPLPGEIANYVYAPQQVWGMPAQAPSVNMQEQWVDVDGQTTQFNWYAASDNRQLTDAEIQKNGDYRFRFKDVNTGDVYATWSHPAFPDFAGADIYRSANVTPAEMPTSVRASFTTVDAAQSSVIMTATKPDTYVYIDWAGDNNPEQYKLSAEQYTIFPCETYADADVRVLTYEGEDGIGVFSLSNVAMEKADLSGMNEIYSLNASGWGLDKDQLVLPPSKALRELTLSGNNIGSIDLSYYENLESLTITDGNLTAMDATVLPKLQRLMLANNTVKDLKLANQELLELDLSGNELESIDLSGAPHIVQLWLSNNLLTAIDVSALNDLRVLMLYHNYFKLTTLPRVLSTYNVYYYADQVPWDVEPENGVVDLSEQLMVGTNRTSYRWFRDGLAYDEEGNIVGDEMQEGVDYTVSDGVFTFLKSQHNARCLLTNVAFPNIVYVTVEMDIATSGVDEVAATALDVVAGHGFIEVNGAEGRVTIFTADGRVAGQAAGSARFDSLDAGIYVVSADGKSAKVIVK